MLLKGADRIGDPTLLLVLIAERIFDGVKGIAHRLEDGLQSLGGLGELWQSPNAVNDIAPH